MKEEEDNQRDSLLAKDKINNAKEEKIEPQKLDNANNRDDFSAYTTVGKIELFALFFAIGIFNHLGAILVMTGGRLLAASLHMDDYLTIYTSASILFAFITRIINSKLCVTISYKKRIYFLCIWFIAGYLLMFLVLLLHDTALKEQDKLCFILSFIPCFFLGSSYAFGESAILAYLRLYPTSLIAGWSSGTGLSGIVGGLLNFLSQLNEHFSLKYLYLILVIVGPLYVYLFELTFKIYYSNEKNKKKNMELIDLIGETDEEDLKEDEIIGQGQEIQKNEDINAPGSLSGKSSEEKKIENMNIGNKSMNLDNFVKVMKSCGDIIGNLGLIYFLLFFCITALVKRVCDKVDIGFLPESGNLRRGKYEFINLFFQIGMFLSKTIIQIVRKIQPIYIYTIVIAVINILFIIEYYVGFIKWGNYIWICLILGFFGGGTYAGGFYTILNSDRVDDNLKELTVNIATAFNDIGTFLSGIAGFLGLKYWFKDGSKF